MSVALGFESGIDRDFESRLARLRWIRAAALPPREIAPNDLARSAFSGSDVWIFVREPSALPLLARRAPPAPPPGRVLAASTAIAFTAAAPHTLRELEAVSGRVRVGASRDSHPPALAFRVSDFPPGRETARSYVERLAESAARADTDEGFLALRLADTSGEDRSELTRFFDRGPLRILDVGCGAGGASAALKARNPRASITGIERRAEAAALARSALDRVLEADAPAALEQLVRAGEKFDGFLFADVLEHLADPTAALERASELAAPGARLVASVPNVGHLSIVRDLVAGRFDPVPAGLCDAGHLRWFTRASLVEALEETGWQIERISSLPGAPAAAAADFLERFADFEGLDRESLATYQWMAIARHE